MIVAAMSWLLRKAAPHHRIFFELYRRTDPSPRQWADFLREHSNFYAIGSDCHISPRAGLFDREYVRIGNNVWIEDCFIVGHDGSVEMINSAFGTRLDKVGKIDIRDNVAIGIGAKILPGVTIGPNAIVEPGSVVVRDVPPNTVVSGVPAKEVGKLDELVRSLEIQNAQYPWRAGTKVQAEDTEDAANDRSIHQARAAALFE